MALKVQRSFDYSNSSPKTHQKSSPTLPGRKQTAPAAASGDFFAGASNFEISGAEFNYAARDMHMKKSNSNNRHSHEDRHSNNPTHARNDTSNDQDCVLIVLTPTNDHLKQSNFTNRRNDEYQHSSDSTHAWNDTSNDRRESRSAQFSAPAMHTRHCEYDRRAGGGMILRGRPPTHVDPSYDPSYGYDYGHYSALPTAPPMIQSYEAIQQRNPNLSAANSTPVRSLSRPMYSRHPAFDSHHRLDLNDLDGTTHVDSSYDPSYGYAYGRYSAPSNAPPMIQSHEAFRERDPNLFAADSALANFPNRPMYSRPPSFNTHSRLDLDGSDGAHQPGRSPRREVAAEVNGNEQEVQASWRHSLERRYSYLSGIGSGRSDPPAQPNSSTRLQMNPNPNPNQYRHRHEYKDALSYPQPPQQPCTQSPQQPRAQHLDDSTVRNELLSRLASARNPADLRALTRHELRNDAELISKQNLLALDEASVQRIMQLLQSELDRAAYDSVGTNPAKYRKNCLRLLRQLSKTYQVLPHSLMLLDVERHGTNPVAGGGYADIWRGSVAEIPVCLKVLRLVIEPDKETRDKIRKDFCHEALVWRQLMHPNILPLLGVNAELFSPSFCLISPWMNNGDIITYLKHNPDHDLNRTFSDIAAGLYYLHSRDPPITHGDIRGANILVTPDARCCLADFGLTLIASESGTWSSATSTGTMKGAIRWMAPELVLANTSNSVFPTAQTTPMAPTASYRNVLNIIPGISPGTATRLTTAAVQCTFKPSLPDELKIYIGETLNVQQRYDDGWALCADVKGEIGMVPLACLGLDTETEESAMPSISSRDVYAFGCTVVEILTLKPPFYDSHKSEASVLLALMHGERPPRPKHTWCTDSVWEFMNRCWSESTEERPKSHDILDFLFPLIT